MSKRSPEAERRHYARRKERLLAQRLSIPFIGCDGEGIGERGEERYALLRIGDRELYRDDERLTTYEMLRFILASPPREQAILAGYCFDYDVSNILRDIPMDREREGVASRWERILHWGGESEKGKFTKPWTWVILPDGPEEFGIIYLPRHYFSVCYCDLGVNEYGDPWRYSRPGSIRTIWDVSGFFAGAFLNALRQWGIGERHWHLINRMKRRRGRFLAIDDEIRRYNALECELLAELMGRLREACAGAGIHLHKWNGAGQLAQVMLTNGGAMRRVAIEAKLPKGLIDLAHAAYYGGRTEAARIGAIDEPIMRADINSSYPAALQEMPCHRHGRWRRIKAAALQHELSNRNSLFVAGVSFSHKRNAFLCGLPFRLPSGALIWPREGRGVYWSTELRSAQKLGATIAIEGHGWLYYPECDCRPYAFLKTHYEARLALGKDSRGLPLKAGINAVYGKLTQRIGGAPWQDAVCASLTTSITRARMNDAIAAIGPRNVVMISTDAIYATGQTTAGFKLRAGPGLGQWDIRRYPSLFVVRAGLFWPPRERDWQLKSRGMPLKLLEPRVPQFVAAWGKFIDRYGGELEITPEHAPKIAFMVPTFIGHRLAFHLGRHDDVCRWLDMPKVFSFDWSEKRGSAVAAGRSLILGPRSGDAAAVSLCYTRDDKVEGVDPGTYDWRRDRMLFEAMPDHVDLSCPHL